jgi:hypothetical protein
MTDGVNVIFTIRWGSGNGINKATCDMRACTGTFSRKMDLRENSADQIAI